MKTYKTTQELINEFENQYRDNNMSAELSVDVKNDKLLLTLEGIIQKEYPLPFDYELWKTDIDETARDLLNWKQLSRLLAGNPESIRRDSIPKKYFPAILELVKLLRSWIYN